MEKVALVLGGTVPHMELILQLKNRGYYTILIDYLENPPAADVADEHIVESTLDKEKVLEIAVERKVELVISGCVDQANISACYAMEKLGKYVPYNYEIARKVTNKGYMKEVMFREGIPTSKYVYVERGQEVPDMSNMRYPLMVKPADSNSANGVKRANNKEEMEKYLSEALKISRNGRGIVEEFVEGMEISAYCFIIDGRAHLLMTAERVSVTEGNEKVIKCYASVAPARISEKAKENAEKIATQIAQAFNIYNSPLFFQGIVRGDDIFVIEFAPRVAGGKSFKTIRKNTGFDIIAATIDSYLGNKVNLNNHNPESIYVVNTIYGEDGIYDHLEGAEQLLESGVIEDVFYHKKRGAVIDNKRASSSRIGAFIVKASNEKEMYDKVEEAYKHLDAFNIQGESMIRRDLNITSMSKRYN